MHLPFLEASILSPLYRGLPFLRRVMYGKVRYNMYMENSISQRRSERLEARITPEQKELFRQAAVLRGQKFTDFIVSSIREAAEKAIRTHQTIRLGAEESERFARILLDPPEPNDKLKAAATRYSVAK